MNVKIQKRTVLETLERLTTGQPIALPYVNDEPTVRPAELLQLFVAAAAAAYRQRATIDVTDIVTDAARGRGDLAALPQGVSQAAADVQRDVRQVAALAVRRRKERSVVADDDRAAAINERIERYASALEKREAIEPAGGGNWSLAELLTLAGVALALYAQRRPPAGSDDDANGDAVDQAVADASIFVGFGCELLTMLAAIDESCPAFADVFTVEVQLSDGGNVDVRFGDGCPNVGEWQAILHRAQAEASKINANIYRHVAGVARSN